MKPIHKLFVVIILFAMCAVVRAEIVEQILVKVNGDIITKTDLEQRQVATLRQRGQQFANADKNDEVLRKALLEITPQVIVEAVDELLLVQRGKELGYKLTDEDFKRVVDNIKKENKIESEEQFQAALKQEGMTMADLRKSLEKQMLISRVQSNEVMNKIGITDEEAQAYYNAHMSEFTTPQAITLREILVSVPSDGKVLNVGLDEEAKQKAEAIRARIVAGESFEKLAGEVSDAPSKANGGLIGPIDRPQLAPALQQVLDTMKVGDVSPAFRTTRGYQIIKLESATAQTVLPFDKARDQIADKVFAEKRKGEFQKYLQKLRAQAIIEWKNEEIHKAYEKGLESGN